MPKQKNNNERHARAQPGKRTHKKSQKRESKEKTPYWEVEFMFFWLMQNFFPSKLKSLFDKKKSEMRTRCGRLYFQQWGNFSIAFLWLALRENIQLYFCLSNSLTPAPSYVHMNGCTTQILFMCVWTFGVIDIENLSWNRLLNLNWFQYSWCSRRAKQVTGIGVGASSSTSPYFACSCFCR